MISYTDSSYENNIDTRKSHSDYVFKLWNGSISHSFKRQNTVATSSIKVEYIAQCNAAKKAFFIAQAMIELEHKINSSVDLRADNQGAIKLVNNSMNHTRTKHIPIQYHYVRELVENGHVKITYVSTKEMIADGLIKPLPPEKFRKFIFMLGLTSTANEGKKVWP